MKILRSKKIDSYLKYNLGLQPSSLVFFNGLLTLSEKFFFLYNDLVIESIHKI